MFLTFALILFGSIASYWDAKEEIRLKNEQLMVVKSDHERSLIHLELAKMHLRDQEMERAFRHFLQGLELQAPQMAYAVSEEESCYFNEAMGFYLYDSKDPKENAAILLDRYEALSLRKDSFHTLTLIIASAYANLDRFEDFFDAFFRAYSTQRDHFLSYRNLGILHGRLALMSKTEGEREAENALAENYLMMALENEKNDISLYRILINLAKRKEDKNQLFFLFKEMVKSNVAIARGDIFEYVRLACDIGDLESGRSILNHAKKLYSYSRTISAAEEYIDQKIQSNR